jgi:hypothetical protein
VGAHGKFTILRLFHDLRRKDDEEGRREGGTATGTTSITTEPIRVRRGDFYPEDYVPNRLPATQVNKLTFRCDWNPQKTMDPDANDNDSNNHNNSLLDQTVFF